MRLPTPLLRHKKNVHKNTFGHIFILAGSKCMVGAAALSSLAAMRSGAGLVTLGIPQSLNSIVQKKISNVIMTRPLKETKEQSLAFEAYRQVQESYASYDAIAIGPGLSLHKSTQKFICKVIATSSKPLIIDADALSALNGNLDVLKQTATLKILTPHPGEMARLAGLSKPAIEKNRLNIAKKFAQNHQCVLLLKGNQTIVASAQGKIYVNKTGNPGMATAGSGDVLTGMIAAFIGQGMEDFEAVKYGAYFHGKAGDFASQSKTRVSMIASDIIENIPLALGQM